jgi:hypothetical protein
MKLKRRHRSPVPAFLLTFWLIAISFPCFAHWLWAAEVDLKPGDTIGPENWEKVKAMVGENLLNRIKQGYTLKIKQGRSMGVPKEYNAATGRYSGEARLGSNGDLLNYVAGLPFPDVHLTDPQIG